MRECLAPRAGVVHTLSMRLRIYVDFDDVICETARPLCGLLQELYGKHVPYDEVAVFDLEEAFGLAREQYEQLMARAHEVAFLDALLPTPGAVEVLQGWLREGFEPEIVTGRPADTGEISRRWLARWGLDALPIAHVDKYGRHRDVACPAGERLWSLETLKAQPFVLAIDDSPIALELLGECNAYPILIFERPWNATYVPSTSNGTRCRRCRDWPTLDAFVRAYLPR